MRSSDILLKDLPEILTLYQYLYMSDEHYIDVKTPATTLRITLNEDLNFKCKNLNFPDLPASSYNDMMTLNQALGIIDQLKHTPGVYKFKENATMWEEICDITSANVGLNLYYHRKSR